jgi:hypothetical protein
MSTWVHSLPEPEALQRLMLTLAALDLILEEEAWLRVHRYDPRWTSGAGLGVVDNGAGDDVYVVFAPEGIIVKGFDHLSPLSPHAREEYEVWPGMYDSAPEVLLTYLNSDPDAFDPEEVTFCAWREVKDIVWNTGVLADAEGLEEGASFLLGFLDRTPEEYADWAVSYYNRTISLPAVQHLYSGVPVSAAIIRDLNPARDVKTVLAEIEGLGLPVEI